MKNKIAYYLEDPKRLDEVTLHELNRWIEQMPYSQPLRLLADMKSDRFVANQDEKIGTYGAYFAEDYEWSNSQKGTDTPKVEEVARPAAIESIVNPVSETASEAALAVGPDSDEGVGIAADVESVMSPVEYVPTSAAEIKHPLAADDREDKVLEEVLETNEVVEVVYEVAHTEASDIEENEIDRMVLELDWQEAEEVSSLSQLDQIEGVDEEPEIPVDKWQGNVNYGSFVSAYEPATVRNTEDNLAEGTLDSLDIVDDDIAPTVKKILPKKNRGTSEKQAGKKKRKEKNAKVKKERAKPLPILEEEISAEDEITKAKAAKKAKSKLKQKSNKEGKEDKKVKSRKSRDADSPSKSIKLEGRAEKKKKKKSKDKTKDKIKADKSDKTVLSKALHKAEVKAKIKPVTNDKAIVISENEDQSIAKRKAEKKSGKKKKKKGLTTLIAVADAAKNDFKLKNYEGVSNYTNWLLQQKTVNGDHPIVEEDVKNIDLNRAEKEQEVAKKKKKKPKEISKTAKVAKKSVRKAEVIISEPLADILAAQGHNKKARKMYSQLSLIFPEKSVYFAAKIENLKKI